jgi:hypothetical protein
MNSNLSIRQTEKEKAAADAGKAIGVQHAANMRAKRHRPEILEAIIAVRGHNNPDNHPYTVAARILPGVNAWLEERGYKPVLKKALAGRIAHT